MSLSLPRVSQYPPLKYIASWRRRIWQGNRTDDGRREGARGGASPEGLVDSARHLINIAYEAKARVAIASVRLSSGAANIGTVIVGYR